MEIMPHGCWDYDWNNWEVTFEGKEGKRDGARKKRKFFTPGTYLMTLQV